MIKDLDFPEKLSGSELDTYLARGWYRLGQIIFTTDYIPHAEGWYRVFWLRYKLANIQYGKKQFKLLKDNSRFSISIKPLHVTEEIEDLYQRYKMAINFEASPTVKNYLFDGGIFGSPVENVFESEMIEIRDKGKLVAVGVFDNGGKTIAGILNYYDPQYHKYSLGKFLMLLKINLAKEKEKIWYYPGYIAYGYTKFDYKLFPDVRAAEIFDPVRHQWMTYSASLLAWLAEHTGDPSDFTTP